MSDAEPNPTEAEVLRLLRSLRYGSLEVVVHDGRIVQIEKRERLRPHDPPPRRGTPSPGA